MNTVSFDTERYRHVRNSAYTGALVVCLGLSLSFVSWIRFVLIFFLCCSQLLRRIQVDEEALKPAFGKEYVEYSDKTKRMLLEIY